jgi:energy-coupling factor transport system substrate-specific component
MSGRENGTGAAPEVRTAGDGAGTAAGTDRTLPAARRRTPLTLRELVLVVVLGVVFGFLYWVFVQAWNALAIAMGPAGDLAQHVLFGSRLLVAPITLAILRRPGVGILAEMLAAVIEVVFLGSPVGPLLLLSAALQGIGSEIPFALTRYRRFGWGVFAASGALGAGLVFFWTAYRMGWYGQDLLALRLGVQVLSGIVLGGLLARVIVRALERTGVLADFAIGAAGAGAIPARRVR